jgi:hypothetical protein
MKLYRMMKAAADGSPGTGDRFGMLGVRPTRPGRRGDVSAVGPSDLVRTGGGGLSVFEGPLDNLPPQMKPPIAQHPVWEIDSADLVEGIISLPAGPPHYHVEPAREMTLAEYQALLAATRTWWSQVEWEVP